MPEEPDYATRIGPAIKDFHVESSRFIVGEGIPWLEITLAHVFAPHKIVLRIEANCDVVTEGGGSGGVAKIQVIASPRLRVRMVNLESKEEVKL